MQLVASAVPLVSLDDKFYKKIDQFEKHIPTVPR